ncbi:AAA family ATPase [Halosolutus halophilus]|uniref:AAA family ATPase n=1 Tax=Halosolutus halophilus TaxID=1552990 RepID=UPI00223513BA|nr:AAA family ATPase [Halosolutus halophilus]
MKISGFTIKEFAKEEYTASQKPGIQNLNGESLLVYGPNRSGKSLTFNALLYGLLGHKETIATRSGKGNKVWITYSDGSRFFRGAPRRKYEKDSKTYEKDSADSELWKITGDTRILKQHFIHSHIDQLPLESLRSSELVDLILSVTDIGRKEEIDRLKKSIEDLNEEQIRTEDRISPLQRQRDKLQRQVSQFEGQLSDWETLLDLVAKGRLEKIETTLENHQEIRRRLEELSQKEHGLNRKINEKEKELNEIERYDGEVESLIIEAIKEFVCPVCEERVDSKSAENRLQRHKCPYCNQDHSVQELKDELRDKKSESETRKGELSIEIAKDKDKLSDIKNQINELEAEIPEISELNSLAVRKLREDNQSVDEIKEEANEEVSLLRESLDSHRDQLNEVEEKLENAKAMVQDTEEKLQENRDKLNELQLDSKRNEIADFEQTWSSHFKNLNGDLGQEVVIDDTDGSIVLPGGDDGKRYYRRRGDLSDSEIQLLNISFILSLNEYGNDSDAINWSTVVLDEPFSHLDENIKKSALKYLLGVEQQIILTSSDEYVSDQFDEDHTIELQRKQFEQTSVVNSGEWGT